MQRYGGNTSCVSLDIPGEHPIVFDMGTGMRYFGALQPHDGTFTGSALVTHLHWDHTQGLPFFTPILMGGSQLDVYGPVQEDGRSIGDALAGMIRPPAFPIELDKFPGSLKFHDIGDAEWKIGDVEVMSRLVPHVGPTCGYRVSHGGKSIAYISDHQQPYDGSFTASEGALELSDGADVLIHDSQYTAEEFTRKNTWGHCTVEYAVWLAAEAGARTLALFHHDPMHSDECLDMAVVAAKRLGERKGVEVLAASEGLTLKV